MTFRRQLHPTRRKFILLVFIVSFFSEFHAVAGSFQVRSWHVENGLPDGTVTALAQTPDGYLWVGTPKGLVRFDGVSFSKPGGAGETSLADSRVTGLLVDREGSLWITSRSGIVTEFSHGHFVIRYSGSDSTNRPNPDTADKGADANNDADGGLALVPGRMGLDSGGAVWVMLADGTVLRFRDTGVPSAPDLSRLAPGSARWLISDGSGQIWLAKGDQEYVFQNDHWVPVSNKDASGLTGAVVCPDVNSGIWVAGSQGNWLASSWVRRRTTEGWSGSPLTTPPAPESARSQISAILQDGRGRLWLGMYWSGVYVQSQPGEWERVQMEGPLAQSIVTCLLEDHDGAVWAGTIGEGLHQIVPKLVSMVMLPPDAGDGIVNTAFAAPDGSIWIGTDGKGIFRWEPGRFTRYGLAEGLPHEHVCAILEDARSNLWAGTWAGLSRFDGTRFSRVEGPSELQQPITTLFADRSGSLWAGGRGCLLRRSWKGAWSSLHYAGMISNLDVRCFAEDRANNVWVATIGSGLLQVRGNRLVPMGAKIGLKRTDVRSLYCDMDGVLWIGTLNGGLFRFSNGTLKHFSMADGFPDDSIISLIADDLGNLWMSSNNGIFGCSRHRMADYVRGQSPALLCWRLAPANGLANRGCSGSGQPAASCGTGDRLWFADMRGVANFDPSVVTRGGTYSRVLVESVTADGVTLHKTGGALRAPANTRRFEFHYTAPDLAAPQMLRFRYRLEPLDREWVEAGTARIAAYSRLQPETYRFRVMVGGADGQWHEAAGPVVLTVVPRFWQTTWFRALSIGTFVILVALTVKLNERRKLRRRLERMEAQQALETERRRIARDLHDDLGAGLAEVVLLGELSRRGSILSQELPEHVSTMTDKTRALVTAMDEIVWTVNPRNDSVKSLAAYLAQHMQRFLAPAKIRCRMSIPEDLPETPVSAQGRHNVFLAVKEAVHNIAKHSGANEVWFHVECAGGKLVLRVEDNGHGFDPVSANGDRHGLNNMRSRLQTLGGSARFDSRSGGGTAVVFTIPLGNDIPVK